MLSFAFKPNRTKLGMVGVRSDYPLEIDIYLTSKIARFLRINHIQIMKCSKLS